MFNDYFEAIKKGDIEYVQANSTAEVLNIRHPELGETPLTLAATVGHYGILAFLLKRGADREIGNASGNTAYQIVFDAKRTILMKLFSTY